ncbi:MAG: DUF1489 domain-containing protein [Hyphomonadaceae bacterium]|nr:DUF1489 domain-containing protein [Hyphomonadaceae bacterium]MBC6413144.1 DUF1489 domain-containing protein [Hyphomonadaceae bacterium]
MSLHLQKLSVGSESIETLADWQRRAVSRRMAGGLSPYHEHVTRMFPRRKDEILDGGSIYWVIKGIIQCRNRIVALDNVVRRDGIKACSILMEPRPIPVVPIPKRPFQGWRYLKVEDAPDDLECVTGGQALPPELRTRLLNLGAW